MPTKEKTYRHVQFPAQIIMQAFEKFKEKLPSDMNCEFDGQLSYSTPDMKIAFDSIGEFEKAGAFSAVNFNFARATREYRFHIYRYDGTDIATVAIQLQHLRDIDEVLQIFDLAYPKYKKDLDEILRQNAVIFLGHGRNAAWRDLKDHLHEKHGLNVIAYETGARAGYTVKEVLEELSTRASIAFLIHTAEDISEDRTLRTRENVVHETGLFQGILGFRRAIVLLEDGCGEFSNIVGINQIRFSKGNIREAFGDVLAVIRRELGASLFR